jgi:hypothetical protein
MLFDVSLPENHEKGACPPEKRTAARSSGRVDTVSDTEGQEVGHFMPLSLF